MHYMSANYVEQSERARERERRLGDTTYRGVVAVAARGVAPDERGVRDLELVAVDGHDKIRDK
jgi:hypothetical protein